LISRNVNVQLPSHRYEVRIQPGLLESVGDFVKKLPGVSSIVIVSDSNVADLYGKPLLESLARRDLEANLLSFQAGEQHKTLSTCSEMFDRLFSLEPALDRSSLLITLGGGVPGDLGGFLAATALRGIRFLQCPTSLLAAVDASTGGKTGVDHAAGKNLIGAFHQPVGVLIDPLCLKSLPSEEFKSGLAECVKHAVIRSADLMELLESRRKQMLCLDPEAMTELIAANVQIKADVVVADEREQSLRAILNYGHTFGHAFETLMGYGQVTHGQAVAWGMLAANCVAVSRGLLDEAAADRVARLLGALGLSTRPGKFEIDDIWARMLHDKKTRSGRVMLILPSAIGSAEIFNDLSREEVARAMEKLWGE
jgi:3-dehydroquinate synthase